MPVGGICSRINLQRSLYGAPLGRTPGSKYLFKKRSSVFHIDLIYYRNHYLYLSTKCWNFILTGYPDCLILIVSSIPEYLNCSSTTGISKRIGNFSLLGLMHLTNQGLHLDIDSSSCCRPSLNLQKIRINKYGTQF